MHFVHLDFELFHSLVAIKLSTFHKPIRFELRPTTFAAVIPDEG
jgi:hypothetical protein